MFQPLAELLPQLHRPALSVVSSEVNPNLQVEIYSYVILAIDTDSRVGQGQGQLATR